MAGGLCPQGWPKLAMNVILESPADGGIAVGVFAGAKATFPPGRSVPAGTAVAVDTAYPFGDEVVVTVVVPPPSDGTSESRSHGQGVPLRVRVPVWATRATVAVASSATSSDANNAASTWSNETDRTPVVAGSMHLVMCPPGTTTLVTLTLNPELEVELGWGDAAVQKGGKLSYRSDQLLISSNFTWMRV